jgi:hypothetical protein
VQTRLRPPEPRPVERVDRLVCDADRAREQLLRAAVVVAIGVDVREERRESHRRELVLVRRRALELPLEDGDRRLVVVHEPVRTAEAVGGCDLDLAGQPLDRERPLEVRDRRAMVALPARELAEPGESPRTDAQVGARRGSASAYGRRASSCSPSRAARSASRSGSALSVGSTPVARYSALTPSRRPNSWRICIDGMRAPASILEM